MQKNGISLLKKLCTKSCRASFYPFLSDKMEKELRRSNTRESRKFCRLTIFVPIAGNRSEVLALCRSTYCAKPHPFRPKLPHAIMHGFTTIRYVFKSVFWLFGFLASQGKLYKMHYNAENAWNRVCERSFKWMWFGTVGRSTKFKDLGLTPGNGQNIYHKILEITSLFLMLYFIT